MGLGKKEPPASIVSFCVLGTILRVMHASCHLILTPTCFYFPQLQIRKLMSREAKFPKLVNRQRGIIFNILCEIFQMGVKGDRITSQTLMCLSRELQTGPIVFQLDL